MRFLANENFPGPSIDFLTKQGIKVKSIDAEHQGATDELVMRLAISEDRIILTHDSDYGELIFKHGYKPPGGVIYFRIIDFEPE